MEEKPKTAPSKLPNVSKVRTVVDGSAHQGDKEISIAARSKGPGPAAYTLPSTIGLNAKNGKKRAPAYSFGTKIDYDYSERKYICQTPGPNAFFPLATRHGRISGPAFSLQGGFKKDTTLGYNDTPGKDTPGPGKYNPLFIPAKGPKAPAYSIGGRKGQDKASNYPGPAEYSIHSTLGPKPLITVPSTPAYSIKPSRAIKLDFVSPGPAAYCALNPSKIKNTAPAYSLGGKWAQDFQSPFSPGDIYVTEQVGDKLTEKPTPGPGHYTPPIPTTIKSSNPPRFSFRVKHSEYELFIPDTVEGEFIF